MPRKLGRSARLRVTNLPSIVGVETINESGLRMTFDVLRTMDPAANAARIDIWNANAVTRGLITREIRRKRHLSFAEQLGVSLNAEIDLGPDQVPGIAGVELEAGYGNALGLIFTGTSQRGDSERQGRTEWRTSIWAGDDETGLREGTLHKSYEPGTGVTAVVVDLVRSMHASIGPVQVAVINGAFASDSYTETTFPYGHVCQGKSLPQLTEILSYIDVRWSIQDGEFVVVRPDGTIPGPPVDVSTETGMVGRPRLRENAGLEVTHLLDHRFRPGGRVNLRSLDFVGTYRIDAVRHTGDTHGGGEFTSRCMLTSLVPAEVAA